MSITVRIPNIYTNQFIKKQEKELIEETPTHIRIPISAKQENDIIRMIKIDPSQGITALYSTNRHKILTFLFDKCVKSWTISSVKSWVETRK